MQTINRISKEGFNITEHIYTEEDEKERERIKRESAWGKDTNDSWGGQGTINGTSTYGKFGNGGQS